MSLGNRGMQAWSSLLQCVLRMQGGVFCRVTQEKCSGKLRCQSSLPNYTNNRELQTGLDINTFRQMHDDPCRLS